MYVASLNIDLLFKKVFSNPKLAKKFLEDFLGRTITKLVVLGVEHKLSDDSVIVKFDYRCMIDGEYAIIEMQQKYKKDVIKRFYLYHCIDTGLQLETLKSIEITRPNGETYKEKDYSGVVPVLTIIWMVDDTLNFEDDFIVFTTLPEAAKDFISDNTLWSQPLETILAARAKVLTILNNDTKNLDFLQKNKMIYVFQDNIVKNKHNKPYAKWFELAKKSKNPNNVKSDFDEFKNNKVMAEVLRRLEKTKLEPYEFKYVSDLYQYENMVDIAEQNAVKAEQNAVKAEQNAVIAEQNAVKAEQNAVIAEQKAERANKEKQEKQEQILKAVHGFLMLGKDVPYIAGLLGLSIEETQSMAEQMPHK